MYAKENPKDRAPDNTTDLDLNQSEESEPHLTVLEKTDPQSSSIVRGLPNSKHHSIPRLSGIFSASGRELIPFFAFLNVALYQAFQASGILPSTDKAQLFIGFAAYCLVGVVLIFSCGDIFSQSLRGLRKGRVVASLPLSLFGIIAFSLLTYLTFVDPYNESYAWYGKTIVAAFFLISLFHRSVERYSEVVREHVGFHFGQGTYLRYSSPQQAQDMKSVPDTTPDDDVEPIHDRSHASLRPIPFDILREGDTVFLEEGDIIPVDAEVTRGYAIVDERRYSGHVRRRVRNVGHMLWAGSKLVSGKLDAKVVSRSAEAEITHFTDYLDATLRGTRKLEEKASLLSHCYGLAILFLSACTFLYWYQSAGLPERAFVSLLGMLAIAPLVFFFQIRGKLTKLGLSKLFMSGILIIKSEVLERLSKMKYLIFHFSPDEVVGQQAVMRFELLDSTYSLSGLKEALACLLSYSSEPIDCALAEYVSEELPSSTPRNVGEVQLVPGYGLSGIVDGADISVGTEGFLVERGIYVQPSDLFSAELRSEGEEVYIAIQEHVIARALVSRPLYEDGSSLFKRLRKQKRRLLLFSDSENKERIDAFGKDLGLDLAEISSDLDEKAYQRKIEMLQRGVALYAPSPAPASIRERVDVSFSLFDPKRWDFAHADIYLMNEDVELMADAFSTVDSLRFVERVLLVVGGVLGALLVLGAASGLVPPVVILLSSIAASLFCLVLSFVVFPSRLNS